MRILFALSTAFAFCLGEAGHGAIWYVDGAVSASGDGRSWPTAFRKIRQGMVAASDGDTVIVAQGTYAENVDFGGKNVVLRGTNPRDPNIVANTIISGSRSASVVKFAGTENNTCVLDGFTIRDGEAGQSGGGISGGTTDDHTHAAIRNNVITRNAATLFGGGIAYCDGIVQNNLISLNSAYDGGGLSDCHGTIRGNTITGNTAEYKGGGLFDCDGFIENNNIAANTTSQGAGLAHCDGVIRDNLISANSAKWVGGVGICNASILRNVIIRNSATDNAGGVGGCDGAIRSNLIVGNSAGLRGGGLHTCDGAVLNNTIVRNSASESGGGVNFCRGTIANCILWGNTAPADAQVGESSLPTHSCIQDWDGGGEGNTALEPRFADADGPDNNFSTYEDNDYHLLDDSPCIDEGTNSVLAPPGLDLDANLRIARWKYPIVAIVDMGAYEYNSRPFTVTDFGFVTLPWPGGRRLVWNSQPDDTYTVWSSYSLAGQWNQIATVPSQGETTSYTATGLLPWNWRALFYQVEME